MKLIFKPFVTDSIPHVDCLAKSLQRLEGHHQCTISWITFGINLERSPRWAHVLWRTKSRHEKKLSKVWYSLAWRLFLRIQLTLRVTRHQDRSLREDARYQARLEPSSKHSVSLCIIWSCLSERKQGRRIVPFTRDAEDTQMVPGQDRHDMMPGQNSPGNPDSATTVWHQADTS